MNQDKHTICNILPGQLSLTKQLGKSLLLNNYYMMKCTSCGCEKDVSLFENGQIIGMHQAEKTSKTIAKT